jgi:hypothetical protein
MRLHRPAVFSSLRELLFDSVALGLGVMLVVLAATGLNRLPYPGSQPYAHQVAHSGPVPAALPDAVPGFDDVVDGTD